MHFLCSSPQKIPSRLACKQARFWRHPPNAIILTQQDPWSTFLDDLNYISDLKLFSFTYPILQVIGGCFRYDRRWRKCGRSCDSTNFLQRIQIFKTNRHNSNGYHDHMLHPPIILNILPTMGWDVLWPIKKGECDRRRVLLVWMEIKWEGERFSSSKLEVFWEQCKRKRWKIRLCNQALWWDLTSTCLATASSLNNGLTLDCSAKKISKLCK